MNEAALSVFCSLYRDEWSVPDPQPVYFLWYVVDIAVLSLVINVTSCEMSTALLSNYPVSNVLISMRVSPLSD